MSLEKKLQKIVIGKHPCSTPNRDALYTATNNRVPDPHLGVPLLFQVPVIVPEKAEDDDTIEWAPLTQFQSCFLLMYLRKEAENVLSPPVPACTEGKLSAPNFTRPSLCPRGHLEAEPQEEQSISPPLPLSL